MATKLTKSTKSKIVALDDRPTSTIEVEIGGEPIEVTLRGLSGAEREEWMLAQIKTTVGPGGEPHRIEEPKGAAARMIVMSVIDPDTGDQLFTSPKELARFSSSTWDALFEAAAKLNGLDDDAVEEAAKNSETTPEGSPGSD